MKSLYTTQDKEADYFARCLLMPKDMFVKKFEKHRQSYPKQDLINKLANYFQVESMHVIMRLVDLARELKI